MLPKISATKGAVPREDDFGDFNEEDFDDDFDDDFEEDFDEDFDDDFDDDEDDEEEEDDDEGGCDVADDELDAGEEI